MLGYLERKILVCLVCFAAVSRRSRRRRISVSSLWISVGPGTELRCVAVLAQARSHDVLGPRKTRVDMHIHSKWDG